MDRDSMDWLMTFYGCYRYVVMERGIRGGEEDREAAKALAAIQRLITADAEDRERVAAEEAEEG